MGGRVVCTLTAIGHDRHRRLVGFTAGHCGDRGAAVAAADRAARRVGRVEYSSRAMNYAVIVFDPTVVAPTVGVGGVAAVGEPARPGETVCKYGHATGTTCGIAWGDLAGSGDQSWTQLCVADADSGAPVVRGGALIGMVNAYLISECAGPEVGTDMAAVLRDLDARHAVGAGFRLVGAARQ